MGDENYGFASTNTRLASTSVSAKRHHVPGMSPEPKKIPVTASFTSLKQRLDNTGGLSSQNSVPIDEDCGDNLFTSLSGKNEKHSLGSSLRQLSQCQAVTVCSVNRNRPGYTEIIVTDSATRLEHTLCLHGFWSDMPVECGDTLHVFVAAEQWQKNEPLRIDDMGAHYILCYPETLLGQLATMYRTILSERFRGVDRPDIAAFVGTLVHSAFQKAAQTGLCDIASLTRMCFEMLSAQDMAEEMYYYGTSAEEIMERIQPYLVHVSEWIRKHIVQKRPITGTNFDNERLEIIDVCDIEDAVWAAEYGVRGKIDLSLEARVCAKNGSIETAVVPLELKTGKVTFGVDHKGQVTLYNLMVASAYYQEPSGGLLLYLKDGSLEWTRTTPQNVRGLMQLRNNLAYYLSKRVLYCTDEAGATQVKPFPLPAPCVNQRFCPKCPQLLNCSLHRRLFEQGKHTPSKFMDKLSADALSHLLQEDLDYYRRWIRWLSMEWDANVVQRPGLKLTEMWHRSSGSNVGCMDDLRLVQQTVGHMNTVFIRFSGPGIGTACLAPGDCVIVSNVDQRRYGLLLASIVDISPKEITVVVEKQIPKRHVGAKFRFDRYESFTSHSMNMSSLSMLMNDSERSGRLRSLLIAKRQPVFAETIPNDVIAKCKSVLKNLNRQQVRVILKTLMAQDYVLVQGMPGTGKTITISRLVQILHTLGHTVLITSYTHSGVDNIVLKLKEFGVSVLRLGRKHQVHAECRQFLVEEQVKSLPAEIADKTKTVFDSAALVACTCLATLNHPLFARRKFDFCIVDEATQALQPATFGPLFMSGKFVLVGDPRQLRPVVISKQARTEGMDETLFAELLAAAPDAMISLNTQYRMNSEIMRLSNELVYDGKLQCATDVVANARLTLAPSQSVLRDSWMSKVLSTALSDAVVFLDTQHLPTCQQAVSGPGLLSNEGEANIVAQICSGFFEAGLSAAAIGIIAVYRHQIQCIRAALERVDANSIELEVNTADQYQGRDKQVILVSLVWTGGNNEHKVSELLSDARRINVLLTRAQHKLVLIGNGSAARRSDVLCKLMQIVRSDQVIEL